MFGGIISWMQRTQTGDNYTTKEEKDDDGDDNDDDANLCDGVRSSVEEPRTPLIVVRQSAVLNSISGDAVECRRVPSHLDRRH